MDTTAPSNTNPDNFWQAPPYNSPPSYTHDKPHNNQGFSPSCNPQGPPQQLLQTSQQQTGVFVINNSQPQPPTVVIASSPRPSYAGHQVLACFVLWCCNPLFGLIAFVLAVHASGSSDADGARRLGKASIIVSIVGIVVAVAIVAIIIGVSVSRGTSSYYYSSSSSCYYSGTRYVCGR